MPSGDTRLVLRNHKQNFSREAEEQEATKTVKLFMPYLLGA